MFKRHVAKIVVSTGRLVDDHYLSRGTSGHFHELSTIPEHGTRTISIIKSKGMVGLFAIHNSGRTSSASARSVHLEG